MTTVTDEAVSTGLSLTVDQKTLKAEFARVKAALPTKSGNLPVLSGVLIDADHSGVTLTCYNLDFGLTARLTGNFDIERPGAVVLPAAAFGKLLAKSGPTVRITMKPPVGAVPVDEVEIDTGRVDIDLRCLPRDEYPVLPCSEGQIPFEMFPLDIDAIADVLPAAGGDDTRPTLCGVVVDGTEFAATDSYRLHVFDTGKALSKEQRILPRPFCVAVTKWGVGEHTAALYQEGPFVWVRTDIDNLTVFARVVDGQYPNYRAFVGDGMDLLTVNRPEFDTVLADVIGTAQSLGVLQGSAAPLKIGKSDGMVELSVTAQDVARIRKTVTGKFSASHLTQLAFNPVYLQQLLVGCESGTFLGVDGMKPIQLRDELEDSRVRTRVLMPIRVADA